MKGGGENANSLAPHPPMKIYTKTGDGGETGLFGGGRVAKDSPRVAAYGEVDELNAALGVARTAGVGALDGLCQSLQEQLFTAGAVLATPRGTKADAHIPHLKACLLYTSPSPRDSTSSRMPSSA